LAVVIERPTDARGRARAPARRARFTGHRSELVDAGAHLVHRAVIAERLELALYLGECARLHARLETQKDALSAHALAGLDGAEDLSAE
jgi:hypothetical protein